jgi:hypothetical protein
MFERRTPLARLLPVFGIVGAALAGLLFALPGSALAGGYSGGAYVSGPSTLRGGVF